jgi:DHA3 family multidrug efflux protein-like MFS transporter
MALVFTVAGVVGALVTLLALASRQYRQLSAAYANAPDPDTPAPEPAA